MALIKKGPFAKYKLKFEKVGRGFPTKEDLANLIAHSDQGPHAPACRTKSFGRQAPKSEKLD
jgi:hypothetical protein